MAKKLEKLSKPKLKELQKGVTKALKAKGAGKKKKPKTLDRDKAVSKVLKKIEALLNEHDLAWRDLPLAKHFAAEVTGERQGKPAVTKATRTATVRKSTARKPAAKAGARTAPSRARPTKSRKSVAKTSGTARPVAKKSAARQKSGKLPPKYRNPNDPSQTWAGRGPKPRWLRDYLAGGGSLDAALI